MIDLSFPHNWQAEILSARPLILPLRRFVYPLEAEEVERGALEVLVKTGQGSEPFLATCALGFRDAAVPTGVWSCPNPDEICAVSGGYAYVIATSDPARFTMIAYRPVLRVLPAAAESLLLFVGHYSILGWSAAGLAWQSQKLSDEGVTIGGVEDGRLHGQGWSMMTDKETPFMLDLKTGMRI
jgi:hypothetical protein